MNKKLESKLTDRYNHKKLSLEIKLLDKNISILRDNLNELDKKLKK